MKKLLAALFLALTARPARAAAPAEAAEPAELAAAAAAPAALAFYPPELSAMLGPVEVSTFNPIFPWYPEELEFEVKWGFIKAGKATLTMSDRITLMGRPAYRLISQAVSSKFIDKFHKVRDYNESWMEVELMRSLGYFKHMREGNYAEDTFVMYDHTAKAFKSRKVRPGKPLKEVTGPIPPRIQDVLSALYYTRMQDLKVGGEHIVDVNTGENWPMVIKVLRKARIKVPAGTFDCVVVQPVLREQGLFIQKGHDMLIWMTDDSRHTPVHLEVEVFIGHISGNLIRASQAPVAPGIAR